MTRIPDVERKVEPDELEMAGECWDSGSGQ